MGRNLPLTSGVGYQRVLFDLDPRASSSQSSSNHSSSLHRQGMARQNSLEIERPATLVVAFIRAYYLTCFNSFNSFTGSRTPSIKVEFEEDELFDCWEQQRREW